MKGSSLSALIRKLAQVREGGIYLSKWYGRGVPCKAGGYLHSHLRSPFQSSSGNLFSKEFDKETLRDSNMTLWIDGLQRQKCEDLIMEYWCGSS
ncbi:hypothetical protein CEXT_420131 [Caerostris extrusa]|uniref:Uncharacterized protein n=1 Tax=Caerostris extrusa TaxID=172846 RepID=A0AAV4NB68_CAEEX|nr:hypothetical protein CEXT_420131 [Caerostris extrusa]